MTQILVPSADVQNPGNWTTAPLWSKIDDPNDLTPADYITKANNSTGACRVGPLASTSGDVVDPQSSSGHVLKLDGARSGSRTTTLTVGLYQGTTLIASFNITLTASYALYSYTLTTAQADAITNYADLRLDINCTASGSGNAPRVSACWMEIPGNSSVTLTVEDGAQEQTADDVVADASVPVFDLVVEDGGQGQTVDQLDLSSEQPAATLEVQDGDQAQAADELSITASAPVFDLAVADGSQEQTVDAVTLGASVPVFDLAVADGSQAQAADQPTLGAGMPTFDLVVADGNQEQTVDAVTLGASVPVFDLAVADGSQAQAADAVMLSGGQPAATLEVQDGGQEQTVDLAELLFNPPVFVLVVQDAEQAQTVCVVRMGGSGGEQGPTGGMSKAVAVGLQKGFEG